MIRVAGKRASPLRRRGVARPFESALMFSIKSKRHSDGGRCARNPNRGHKPPKGSARIAAKCLSPHHYAAVARETASVLATSKANSFLRSGGRFSDARHSHLIIFRKRDIGNVNRTKCYSHDSAIVKCRSSRRAIIFSIETLVRDSLGEGVPFNKGRKAEYRVQ